MTAIALQRDASAANQAIPRKKQTKRSNNRKTAYHRLGNVLAVDELFDSGEVHHRLHLLSGHGVHEPLRDGPDRVEQNVRGVDHRALEGLREQVLHQTENWVKVLKSYFRWKTRQK